MSTISTYRYTSLTSAIADTRSPIRAYLDSTFPHKRVLQTSYRASSLPLLVPGGEANPATLGTAFDFAVRFVLDPLHIPAIALHGFRESRRRTKAILEVVGVARGASDCRAELAPEALFRAAWALALTTDVFRSGTLAGSPLRQLRWLSFTSKRLLDLAPASAVRQMQQLHAIATANFYPKLPNPPKRQAIGPTFEASKRCSADADLIIDGCLIELKTRLGPVSKASGMRFDSLPSNDINQLLAYTLFDRSNRFGINQIGLYSARYGNFVSWRLAEYLSMLAGREIDIAHERKIVWRLLHS